MADLETLSEATHDGTTIVGRDSEAVIREEMGLPATTVEPSAAISTAVPSPVEPQTVESPKETAQQKHDRIQRLTYEREQARRDADALKAENERLKAQPAKPAERKRPQIVSFPEDPDDPKPTQADFEDDPSPYDAWTEALGQWTVRQAIKQDRRDRAEEARIARNAQVRHEIDGAFVEALEAHKAAHPDFAAKIEAAADFQITIPMRDGLKASKEPRLMEYLIDHPKEVERIAEMRPIDQYAEMKMLALRLTAAPAGSAVAARPATKAQPPINPVSGSPVVPKDEGPPGDDASDEEWFKWNDRQKQSRRRA